MLSRIYLIVAGCIIMLIISAAGFYNFFNRDELGIRLFFLILGCLPLYFVWLFIDLWRRYYRQNHHDIKSK